jgi:type 1 fimbria pilin
VINYKIKQENLMKKTVVVSCAAALAALLILGSGRARADVVYANSTNDLNLRFNTELFEVGDEIVLDGTARIVTNFNFQYWGVGWNGDEELRVRFYANDGAAAPAGPTILKPLSVLFDTGWFNLASYGYGATDRAVMPFDYAGLTSGNLVNLTGPVPDSFTWTVQFRNVDSGSGESAGVDLYDPPTVGSNYKEFWQYNPDTSDWEYRGTAGSTNINFAARLEATPEPSTIMLGLLAGAGALLLRNRRSRR